LEDQRALRREVVGRQGWRVGVYSRCSRQERLLRGLRRSAVLLGAPGDRFVEEVVPQVH